MLTPKVMPSGREPAKERILLYGYPGSGKTFAWTTLADAYRMTDTPGHFYVISTEWQAADRALEPYDDDSNVTIVEVLDWPELVDATTAVGNKAQPNDWMIVDSIGNAWQFVQDAYVAERWGGTAKEYFGELRTTGRESEINWQVVNSRYFGWLNPGVRRFQGHVLSTSPAEDLKAPARSGKETESKEARELYGRFGVKATGQKRLGYDIHSVILMKSPARGEYTITKVDDHARPDYDNEPVADPPMGFVDTYLRKIAGWTIT